MAVSANCHATAHGDFTHKYTVNVDKIVGARNQLATLIESLWIRQASTRNHERFGQLLLVRSF